MFFFDDDDRDSKRTLTSSERRTLWENAKHKCQACGKEVTFAHMHAGHKKAWSRGGSTTITNSVCLCADCNHDQKADNWLAFCKKNGIKDPALVAAEKKKLLSELTVTQLKLLAKKKGIKVKGSYVEGGLFENDRVLPPTKSQYVNKLKTVATNKEIQLLIRAAKRQ